MWEEDTFALSAWQFHDLPNLSQAGKGTRNHNFPTTSHISVLDCVQTYVYFGELDFGKIGLTDNEMLLYPPADNTALFSFVHICVSESPNL